MVAVLGMILKVQLYKYPALVRHRTRSKVGETGKVSGVRGLAIRYLRVPELDQARLVDYNLVPFVLALIEQFRQSEPLPRHLVPVVCVHKLVVVDAVGRVSLHALDGRLAAVESDDVIHESLTSGGELD